jgi:hypothetical protein
VQEQKKVGRVSSRVQANALVEAEKARLEVHKHYTTLCYAIAAHSTQSLVSVSDVDRHCLCVLRSVHQAISMKEREQEELEAIRAKVDARYRHDSQHALPLQP